MAEISNLMGQFADKIMEQQTDIELIQHHAQETKSNVTQVRLLLYNLDFIDGGASHTCVCMIFSPQSNRILEQTQKIGSGYGFIVFCFYMGFSVILHMLHYFNN